MNHAINPAAGPKTESGANLVVVFTSFAVLPDDFSADAFDRWTTESDIWSDAHRRLRIVVWPERDGYIPLPGDASHEGVGMVPSGSVVLGRPRPGRTQL